MFILKQVFIEVTYSHIFLIPPLIDVTEAIISYSFELALIKFNELIYV